jgi:hypothetical protein
MEYLMNGSTKNRRTLRSSRGYANAAMKKLSPECRIAIQFARRGHGRNPEFAFGFLVLRSENGEADDCTVLIFSVSWKGKH